MYDLIGFYGDSNPFPYNKEDKTMRGKFCYAYPRRLPDGTFAVALQVPENDGSGRRTYPTVRTDIPYGDLTTQEMYEITAQQLQLYDERCATAYRNAIDPAEINMMTVQEAYEQFLKAKQEECRDNTIERYRQCGKRIIEFFGQDKQMKKITKGDAENFKNALLNPKKSEKKLANTTVKDYIRLCRLFFEYAVETGIIPINPFKGLKMPRKTTKTQTITHYDILTYDEIERFIALANECEPEYATYIWIAINFGLRISEIAALSVEAINLKAQRITIDATITYNAGNYFAESQTKNGNARILPMSDQAVEFFKKIIRKSQKTPYTFTSPDGSKSEVRHLLFWWGDHPLNAMILKKPMKRLAYRIGHPRLHFHGLRHSYCSLLHHQGVSLKEAQYLMGHRDLNTTLEIYTHLEHIPEKVYVDYQPPAQLNIAPKPPCIHD